MSGWLFQPWGQYTRATRMYVLLVLLLYSFAQTTVDVLFSDSFTTRFDNDLTTPLAQTAMGFALANVVCTLYIFACGGGMTALLKFAKPHVIQLLFLSLMTCVTLGFRGLATHLQSTTSTLFVIIFVPVFVPLGAVCFERRHQDGHMVQYGMWPCCLGSRASDPHCGVCPGILAIVVACALAISRLGTLATPIGMTCSIIAMMSELLALVTAAVLLGRDKPDLAAPIALAWWVTLIATPVLLLLSLPFTEGERITRFAEQRGRDAAVIYSCSAVANAVTIVFRFALIHAASALTTSLASLIALAVAGFWGIIAGSHASIVVNWTGIFLMLPAVGLHVWYMLEREKMANARLPLAEQGTSADDGTGKADLPGKAEPPSERSALVDAKAPPESGPAGGCEIA